MYIVAYLILVPTLFCSTSSSPVFSSSTSYPSSLPHPSFAFAFTSIPPRFAHLRETLTSLLSQTHIQPELILISIPNAYVRFDCDQNTTIDCTLTPGSNNTPLCYPRFSLSYFLLPVSMLRKMLSVQFAEELAYERIVVIGISNEFFHIFSLADEPSSQLQRIPNPRCLMSSSRRLLIWLSVYLSMSIQVASKHDYGPITKLVGVIQNYRQYPLVDNWIVRLDYLYDSD